ncbi:hypothetical protein CAPTEDRAFT_189475 [Capitella teleta]|uniref:Major facilitator superfamily (MFS) profile domain-containing protein n=1 Tax=Capitella teleta TaxID=283909 RepID=R7V1F9_CAPTE|nr:hypothetical protein CAPTEDRAFT_189475 [Capitella teleta]|eukprot:ELU12332.1 hypothetical protein CAPTEDRAFT_189475 [Capitella teleta]
MDASSSWSQLFTFVALWTAYASTYLLRKPIGVIKISVADDLLVPLSSLAWLDIALLLPYAVIQMLFGGLADKFPARCTLSVALLISSFSMFAFGRCDSLSCAVCLLVVNGAAQGICWPSCTKLLSSTFANCSQKRSKMLGLLGTSALVGGSVGTALSVQLLDNLGWRGVFLAPSIVVASLGVMVYFMLRISSKPDKPENNSSSPAVWKWPGVRELAGCVFCLKMVRYALYMWLPVFLEKECGCLCM